MGWHYVVRIKQEEWFRKKDRQRFQDWVQCRYFIKKEGQAWYGEVILWKEHEFRTSMRICWEEGYEEPWILVSDLRASHARVTDYGRRMKVESTFQDQKSRLLDIECCRFKNKEHLHRWLFVVFLAIWWLIHLGSSCLHHGHRHLVDRADRRDKGVMRIGHLWFKFMQKRARISFHTNLLSHMQHKHEGNTLESEQCQYLMIIRSEQYKDDPGEHRARGKYDCGSFFRAAHPIYVQQD